MIPDAAVEAAALAMFVRTYERDEWETVINQTKYRYLQDARLALEAALPYMLAGIRPYAIEDQRKHGETW